MPLWFAVSCKWVTIMDGVKFEFKIIKQLYKKNDSERSRSVKNYCSFIFCLFFLPLLKTIVIFLLLTHQSTNLIQKKIEALLLPQKVMSDTKKI